MCKVNAQTIVCLLCHSLCSLLLLSACSRDSQPMVEAVQPAKQTLEKSKEVERTLQEAQEKQQKQMPE